MKLSTRGRYGLMAMLDIAIHYSEGAISVKSIAERQNISESYLEQLFAVLREAGLVASIRGSQGGYALADRPGNITVGSILRALEGSLAPVGCVAENVREKCRRHSDCVTRYLWESIRNTINEVVDGITLENLVEEYGKQADIGNNMYYI